MTSQRFDGTAWAPHRELMRVLWKDEGMTLDELRLELQKRGFKKSKAQIGKRLKAWGYTKNLSKAHWIMLAQAVLQRRALNKESQVWVDGDILSAKKVRKEVRRYRKYIVPDEPVPVDLEKRFLVRTPKMVSRCFRRSRSPSHTGFDGHSQHEVAVRNIRTAHVPSALLSAELLAIMNHRHLRGLDKVLATQFSSNFRVVTTQPISIPQSANDFNYLSSFLPVRLPLNSSTELISARNFQQHYDFGTMATTMSYALVNNVSFRSDASFRAFENECLTMISCNQDLLSVAARSSSYGARALQRKLCSYALEHDELGLVSHLVNSGVDASELENAQGLANSKLVQKAFKTCSRKTFTLLVQKMKSIQPSGLGSDLAPIVADCHRLPHDSLERIKILLDNGVSPDPCGCSRTMKDSALQILVEEFCAWSLTHVKFYRKITSLRLCIRYLIDCGANVNHVSNGLSLLSTALSGRHKDNRREMIETLLEAGADISSFDCPDGSNWKRRSHRSPAPITSPIDFAIAEHDLKLLDLLSAKGVTASSWSVVIAISCYDIPGFLDVVTKFEPHNRSSSLVKGHGVDYDRPGAECEDQVDHVARFLESLLTLPDSQRSLCLATALERAVSSKRHDFAHDLMEISAGLGIHVDDTCGVSFGSCCSMAHVRSIRFLLEAGNMSVEGGVMHTPLGCLLRGPSTYDGYYIENSRPYKYVFDSVRCLLEFGVDPNEELYPPEKGYSISVRPLAEAITHQDEGIAELLLSLGAHPATTHPPLLCFSPLAAAVSKRNSGLISRLLSLGASPFDDMALLQGVLRRDFNALELLFCAADRMRQSKRVGFGWAALQLAIKYQADSPTIIGLLLARTNSLHLCKTQTRRRFKQILTYGEGKWLMNGQPALEYAFEHGIYQHGREDPPTCPIAQQLINAGAEIHVGCLLQAAIRSRQWQHFDTLLSKGADVNARGSDQFKLFGSEREFDPAIVSDRTPLQQAVVAENLGIVEKLITYGARVNDPAGHYRGATALQYAAIHGLLGIAIILLRAGADVNAPGALNDGRTALEGASEHGRLDIVQTLVDCGANIIGPHARQFRQSITRARKQGFIETCDLLEELRQRQYKQLDEAGRAAEDDLQKKFAASWSILDQVKEDYGFAFDANQYLLHEARQAEEASREPPDMCHVQNEDQAVEEVASLRDTNMSENHEDVLNAGWQGVQEEHALYSSHVGDGMIHSDLHVPGHMHLNSLETPAHNASNTSYDATLDGSYIPHDGASVWPPQTGLVEELPGTAWPEQPTVPISDQGWLLH